MSIYPEIPTALTKELNGVRYIVRRYGFGGIVYEEEYIPIPTKKTITFFNEDGTANEDLSRTEYLTKEE